VQAVPYPDIGGIVDPGDLVCDGPLIRLLGMRDSLLGYLLQLGQRRGVEDRQIGLDLLGCDTLPRSLLSEEVGELLAEILG
jgi:hypothetical protein